MKNVEYLLALHSINGLGPIRLKNLLKYFDDPKLIWKTNHQQLVSLSIPEAVIQQLELTRKKLDPEKYLLSLEKAGIKWLTIFDKDYPILLKEIYDPPVVFYYQGEIKSTDEKAVAIVGTRKMSGYGQLVTEKFAIGLNLARVTIVSGLARGVDSCAHRTVVKNQGRTLAVLGGGLKKIFPPENTTLARQISDGLGAVISEFPPDALSLPGNFPARNRIIAGLSRAVLVTEAAEDSGSLITAKLALEQGREVFAVPGPITSDLSSGPLVLIKQGARLVTEAGEILEELGFDQPQDLPEEKAVLTLLGNEQKIFDYLSESKHIDEICRELNLSVAMVSASLIKMEIKRLVKNLGGGFYSKIC